MTLDAIAESIGTIEEEQEESPTDRVQDGDTAGLPDQSGDYEVETGW